VLSGLTCLAAAIRRGTLSAGKRRYWKLPGIDIGRSHFSSQLDDLCPPCKQTEHVRAEEEYVYQSSKPTEGRLVVEYIAHNGAVPLPQEEVVVIEAGERATHK
jgi:hypothetical protein